MTVTAEVEEYIPLTVWFRRARLIDELRGENYQKGLDHLWANSWHDRPTNALTGYFCCIGVGLHLCGVSTSILEGNHNSSYGQFRAEYRTSEKTQKYLVGMNDGTPVSWPLAFVSPKIRRSADPRKFSQIARFLEIIWFGGLTR